MKIKSRQFGELEFDEDKVIKFDDGIIGFEQLKKFILLTEENGIFFWLLSIDEPEIGFPMFPINLIEETYPQQEKHEVFTIVKLHKQITKIQANLKAPIYINQEEKKGYQAIFDNDQYPINYQLFIEN